MNMIIGKRQIILASLVLGLGVAVYLNWTYTNVNSDMPITGALDQAANYGEAQFVKDSDDDEGMDIEITPTATTGNEETFFVEAKLSRQKARDEAVDTLAVMLQDANLSTDQRADLALRATDLANSIEVEGKIENLIKSKGFTDVMVYYDTLRADIILKTDGLDAAQAAQIKDIILKETAISAENISIVEIN